MSKIDTRGPHQRKDTWAALMEIESGDLPILKRVADTEVFLLMIRENVCRRALKMLKEAFTEREFWMDKENFVSFISEHKKIVLDELQRLSITKKNYIPLVKACGYIKKN